MLLRPSEVRGFVISFTLCFQSKNVVFQTRSVIGERNNKWYNRNNAPSPDNKGSYRSYGRMKIEVWKSYRITCFIVPNIPESEIKPVWKIE